MKSTPEVPRLRWMFSIALVKMLFAGPGATLPRFSISGCVAECPIKPRIETSAIKAGKIAKTP